MRFQQQPLANSNDARKQPVDVMLDTSPISDIAPLQPTSPLSGSFSVAQFYMLEDKITGVLALGSFAAADFNTFAESLLTDLQTLTSLGAVQLIVDVTNKGGGFICIAHWLHCIIIGPKSTTVPEAGLFTRARDGPLAQLIVQKILADPNQQLLYNPVQRTNANSVPFTITNWLLPPVNVVINGRPDAFSQRLGSECPPDQLPVAPKVALFEPSK